MKRISCLVLALTLAISAFAGCGEKSAPSKVESTSQSASQIEKEKPVLNYIGCNIAWDPTAEPTCGLLESITGYKMEYSILPADNPAEKLNMDLASGTEYDIARLDPTWFEKLAAQNALLPLNDLIDEYGPNIKKQCLPELFDMTTRDGKIYGLPSPAPGAGVYWGIAMRQDILDELKLEAPNNIDDFYKVLKTVKEKKNIIPLTTAQPFLTGIASAFNLSTYFKDIDGKLVAQPEQAGMKEYLKFMSKLYKDGLLDTDLPINKAENVREKFTSGQAFSLLMTYGSETPPAIIMPAIKQNLPNASLKFILPLENEKGERELPLNKGLENITVIPVTSKHPEDAIKWLNATLEEKNFDLLAIGEEGVHYTKNGDSYDPILPKFFEDKGNSWWLVPTTNAHKFPTYWEELRIKKNMDVHNVYAQLTTAKEYGKVDPTSLMPFNDVTANLKQKLTQMESDYYKRVISGAESIDNFDDFLAKWREAGGAEMTKACNEWYQSK
ncbi:MAG: extracellular solute-binding protein [Oscillospiraceae bacterium]